MHIAEIADRLLNEFRVSYPESRTVIDPYCTDCVTIPEALLIKESGPALSVEREVHKELDQESATLTIWLWFNKDYKPNGYLGEKILQVHFGVDKQEHGRFCCDPRKRRYKGCQVMKVKFPRVSGFHTVKSVDHDEPPISVALAVLNRAHELASGFPFREWSLDSEEL